MKTCLLLAFFTLVGAVTASAQTTTPATDSLTAYVGTYAFSGDSPVKKFKVTTDSGTLFGEADDFGKNKLIRQAKADTYQSTSSYGSIITFVRDAATKAVTGLTLSAQGTELAATREKP